MTTWHKGHREIDKLIAQGALQKVPPNSQWASKLLDIAAEHLLAADATLEISPISSFPLSYDAVHKIFDAILINQCLRGTTQGGHLVLQHALQAQLVPPLGELIEDFTWMRRLRNADGYPTPDRPLPDMNDAREALDIARELLSKAPSLLKHMGPYDK